MREIQPLGNDVLARLVHKDMEEHCTCGFHSDDPDQHGPSHWSERPCAWRKLVTRSSDHVALAQATVERGPVQKLNDAGHVLMLPPGTTPADLEAFKKFMASQSEKKQLGEPVGPKGDKGDSKK